MHKYEIDMTKGSVFKNIIRFAIPLIFTNVLQLLYNAADTIVVGRWAGTNALASVGSTAALNAFFVNIFVAMSIGASVCVSKCFGAGENEKLERYVHNAIIISVGAGIISLVAGETFAKFLLQIMGTPDGVVLDGAVLYVRIFFIGVPFAVLYNFGAAILRAVGDTKRPLYILSATGIINVVLNLFFVIVFNMGVAGVAAATAIANILSAVLVFICLIKTDGAYKFRFKKLIFSKEEFKEILRIGIPAGIQGSVFSLSNMVIQSAVNSFGAEAMAGNTAAASIGDMVYIAMVSFYHAVITLVGQNYGVKNKKRIYETVRTAIICVTVLGLFMGWMIIIFAKPLLGIYIKNSPLAISVGEKRLFVTCSAYFLCGIMEVLSGLLRGMGYSAVPTINSLVGACGFRIIWVFTVLNSFRTIEVLYLCWPLSWTAVIVLHIITFIIIRKKAFSNMYSR
ncbi:MAG: MATE family efflux transporter [Clostridia bacterium]|nr:MATE family efflux transporter [Clostridia bacterium]